MNLSLPGLKSLGISGQSVTSTQHAGENANQAGASVDVGTKFGNFFMPGGQDIPVSSSNPYDNHLPWIIGLISLGALFFIASFFRRRGKR